MSQELNRTLTLLAVMLKISYHDEAEVDCQQMKVLTGPEKKSLCLEFSSNFFFILVIL